MHGYSGNARDFDALAAALAPHARVICVDIAGRGESDWLASSVHYHFGQFISDLNALIDHLGVSEVDWIGTSMGGLLGMLVASQPASPVRSLVMNDVGAYVPIDALRAIAGNLDAPAHFATLADVEAHMRHTHREWGEIDDLQWQSLAVHGSRPDGDGFRLHYDPKIAQVMKVPLATGLFLWGAWHRVRCPVLLVRGERSRIFPAHVAHTMRDAKGDAQLAEIAGAGHAPSLMAESQVAIVRDFLGAQNRWRLPHSSSSPGSSRMPTHSAPRSPGSSRSRPAPSPT